MKPPEVTSRRVISRTTERILMRFSAFGKYLHNEEEEGKSFWTECTFNRSLGGKHQGENYEQVFMNVFQQMRYHWKAFHACIYSIKN